ncbi:MAG: NAD(P)/FAD-dependent oxidoreductase, partial [Sphingomonas sp.]
MTSSPYALPPADTIDIPAMRAKYRQERDKRVNRSSGEQYVQARGEFEEVYDVDPHTPLTPRDPIVEDLDVAVLGAGWAGVLASYHLKKSGITTFRNIDHAGGWGGVWYWNRYPGLQCDNDAYCYLPLLEETGFMPSKKFADGHEIRGYINQIVDQFGLGEGALFHTRVTDMAWDEGIQRWRIQSNRGDEIRARFVVMANGLLNIPKLPGIPGIGEFKGKMFHTGRWDYDYTGGDQLNPVLDKLHDKKVAIIGTGATSVQAVPFLGAHARQLYVLQRTPSTVDYRVNTPTDPA